MKKRVMVFCDSYLPGYRGGGGLRAVHNFAETFKSDFDFYIVTRDCDGKSDPTPFIHAARDKWNLRPEAQVYYASPAKLTRRSYLSLIREVDPDVIYLNSVFSYVCVKFLFTRHRYALRDIPLIIAPCGEFALEALRIKSAKKQSFLALSRILRLFSGAFWKASNPEEKRDIETIIEKNSQVFVAPELLPNMILPDFDLNRKPEKLPGSVNLIFYARIAPIKNLLYILKLLRDVKSGDINLSIVGPPEDREYYSLCAVAAQELPENIKVIFHGGKRYESGLKELFSNHFMLMPTESENFGYVIIEALAAGSPVIASDRIPTSINADPDVLKRLSIDDPNGWLDAIQNTVYTNAQIFLELSKKARETAEGWLKANTSQESWKSMLTVVLDGGTDVENQRTRKSRFLHTQ